MNILPPTAWRHVPTATNPADCASRDMLPEELLKHDLWWQGPPWLLYEPSSLPVIPKTITFSPSVPEANVFIIQTYPSDLIERYSELRKLRRVIAWVYRFYHNCRVEIDRNLSITISSEELRQSLRSIILLSQSKYFPEDLLQLIKGNEVSTSSPLASLRPFLDEHGIIRVGGRLQKKRLQRSQKHPIILHHCHI